MFHTIASLSTARPKLVLTATALLFVIAGALGGSVINLLNADNDSFSDTSSQSSHALERIEAASGLKATQDVMVLVNTDDTKAVTKVRSILSSDPDVGGVVGGPTLAPFVSRDGSQTLFVATYDREADTEAVTERLRSKLEPIKGITVGGEGVAFQEVNETVEADILRAESLAFPILFLVSLFVFRSLVSALLPLLVAGLTIVLSLFGLRLVNEAVDMSIFAVNLITGMGLGLAIDYSLFMVSRFREELEIHGPGAAAVRRTVATAGRTVAFSALTVAGSGVALLFFPLRFLYSMGVGVILVALTSSLVALVALPALFALLGRRVNAGSPKRWRRAAEVEASADHRGFWYRLSAFVMRRPIPIAVAGTAILLTLGSPLLGIKFTGVDATILPDGSSAKDVFLTLRADYPDISAGPYVVAVRGGQDEAAAVSAYADHIGEVDGVRNVAPPAYLGNDVWQITATPEKPPLEPESKQALRDIRDLDAPGSALVGGITADHIDQVAALWANIPRAGAILAALTLVMLFLMTGSVILPLKALVMNVLTISATLGILVFIFQDGRLEGLLDYTSQGALESSNKIFLFAVVFGLSTDYAVFLLTRIKEARDAGLDNRESVAVGIQRTGRIVTAAAILFAIAIGAFATSSIGFMKEFGLGTALAVLIDATLVRALLVPSLMALLGKWNWWAPRPLRRLHDAIGLSEGERTNRVVTG